VRAERATTEEVARARQQLRLDRPYVLFAGTVEPRKNLPRLIAAFERMQPAHPDLELVLAGPSGWGDVAVSGGGVRALGFVTPDQLRALYAGAEALAYPSLREGFGLPVLEAMGLGAAVLTSDRSSLPEVAGDAALSVDPTDELAIAAALRRLATEPGLRTALRARALERAALFSWANAARQTLDLYHEVRELPRRSGQP